MFIQDELVIIRRFGDGKEYRAKVVGQSVSQETNIAGFYIVELIDKIPGYNWTHCNVIESCLDKI